MAKAIKFWGYLQQRRELGIPNCIGYNDQVQRKLYSSFFPRYSWDPGASVKHTHHGGVFNLEFSPDGSLLVAATERKSILLFDPLNQKLVNYVDKAHNDCVNYARFLDSRMFATCSDDTTISLWDVRYLKYKIRSLKGHSNWVKNIEFASNTGLLVTSGFDGSIYTWDINRYSEDDINFERVFHTTGLMRMRLTPDSSKMVICTTSGYLMVIHNLDLQNLAEDLNGFKPNIYRMLQMNSSPIALAENFDHLFTKSRNRVELISDFPCGNDAEVISSLQIHPHGWCTLSRNTSGDENSEWTCLHDIQDIPKNCDITCDSSEEGCKGLNSIEANALTSEISSSPETYTEGSSRTDGRRNNSANNSSQQVRILRDQSVLHIRVNYETSPANAFTEQEQRRLNLLSRSYASHFRVNNIEVHFSGEGRISYPVSSRAPHTNVSDNNPVADQVNVFEASRQEEQELTPMNHTGEASSESEDSRNTAPPVSNSDRSRFFIRTNADLVSPTIVVFSTNQGTITHDENMVRKNLRRLHHYVREPNVGRGFIKELCFSTDGRLICSPYGHGVRLLSYNASCSELCDCIPETQAVLHPICVTNGHQNYVVSTKFSPTHCLLVSGCLNGKICFHQPYC